MEYQLTRNQQAIFDAVEGSQDNFLIQGKPGVGKSVLIRALVEAGNKTYTLAAPTGLAALNIGGRTLHSLFRLPVSQGVIHPDNNNFTVDDRTIANARFNIKHLIIDEVSMVRADTFDFIDRFLRQARGYDKPFGGIQVIIVGDFFQLPPVVVGAENLEMESIYGSPFVFSSKVFQDNFKVMELSEVLRQKGDNKFIDILDRARTGEVSPKDVANLNKRVKGVEDFVIRLAGTNKQADEINQAFLRKINSDAVHFQGGKYGEWPALPAEENLFLKVGAQVMVKMNAADRPPELKGEFDSKVVNGTIGKVHAIEQSRVIIETERGEQVPIYRKRWERKIKERIGDKWEERVVASFEQIPLALAWAISIHKSQGQSFDKVHVDASKIFAPGQLYVALSRCRSLDGLSLETPVTARKFWANKDVLKFFHAYEQA